MLAYRTGNIFESEAQAIVNPTNCLGPMGAGLAKQFSRRYPANTAQYRRECAQGLIKPGRLNWFKTGRETPEWIVNFPTKNDYRRPSRLEYIQEGLDTLAEELTKRAITSIAIPPLGCGLGGLRWNAVRAEMETRLSGLEQCTIILLEPPVQRR